MFMQDLRFALRQLKKNPGFGATAILMLALGIGASVAIFAFVDAALIKPLPYAEPNRLVDVTEKTTLFPRNNLSYPDYVDWKRMNTVFRSLDAYSGTGYLLRTPTGFRASDRSASERRVLSHAGRHSVPGTQLLCRGRTTQRRR